MVQKVKYLGVQVDNSFDWKKQFKVISSMVSMALGLLKHAKAFLPESSLLLCTGMQWLKHTFRAPKTAK